MTRTRLQFSVIAILILAVVAIFASSGSGSKTTAQTPSAARSAVSLRQTPLGKTLVDASGRTLYLFAGDARNLSRLSAAGRAVWPPFTSVRTPATSGGAVAAKIGSGLAGSGARQITYNGHPLYYYVGDHRPGQESGQGLNQFGARWYVVSAAGRPIISSLRSTSQGGSPSPGAGSGGGGSSYTY